jgi:hypothetical protein
MTRPKLEGLFTGNAPADPSAPWRNGTPAAPEPPPRVEAPAAASPTPARPAPPRPTPSVPTPPAEPAGLLDPVALAERYFAMMQALLDMQRDFGMRVAHQVAALSPMDRFRR